MNPSGAIRYFNRRVDESGKPLTFTDEAGKVHSYVYDLECNKDGQPAGPHAIIISWVGVRALDPARGDVHVSQWHGWAGQKVNNEVAHNIGSGWAIADNGLCSVVSLDDVPLVVWNERNIVPTP